jgi:hypothetical protein
LGTSTSTGPSPLARHREGPAHGIGQGGDVLHQHAPLGDRQRDADDVRFLERIRPIIGRDTWPVIATTGELSMYAVASR